MLDGVKTTSRHHLETRTVLMAAATKMRIVVTVMGRLDWGGGVNGEHDLWEAGDERGR